MATFRNTEVHFNVELPGKGVSRIVLKLMRSEDTDLITVVERSAKSNVERTWQITPGTAKEIGEAFLEAVNADVPFQESLPDPWQLPYIPPVPQPFVPFVPEPTTPVIPRDLTIEWVRTTDRTAPNIPCVIDGLSQAERSGPLMIACPCPKCTPWCESER